MRGFPKRTLGMGLIGVLLALPFALHGEESDGGKGEGGAAASATEKIGNDVCLECHSDPTLAPVTDRGKKLTLLVKEDALAGSVHSDLSCADCHGGAKTFEDAPHNDGAPLTLQCRECHADESKAFGESVHGRSRAKGDQEAASCVDCHGSHQILSRTDRRSPTNKFNLSKTCATCHEGGAMLAKHPIGQPEAVSHYVDSIHGKALLVDGLIVAPSCNDCHGVHDIMKREEPASRIHAANVPKTCGRCHVLTEEVYNGSVHGQAHLRGDLRGPTCPDCHTSHQILSPSRPEFRLSIDDKCGKCHEESLERYRETFHGKAVVLGRKEMASCSDCHGHHDILARLDPKSRIGSPANRLETCRQCHEDANPNFANYIVHADHTDRMNHPELYWVFVFMTLLLLGTFAFFALHSLLWLVRSIVLYARDPKSFREAKIKQKIDDKQYVRFKPVDRFLHALIIFSFLLLVLTGMPLKFFYMDWAKTLLDLMGGQAVAAVLHRAGAFITIFYFTVHIGVVSHAILKQRKMFRDPESGKYTLKRFLGVVFGPDSPMPNRQDWRDFVAHQKWFFGRGPKPQFDRWTYWEKFDYFAVFWGVAVIGISGLVMWLPTVFTRFLPGWIINVAAIIHSDEALLAAGFIFTFHFFNVHFRPEKFPMDPVIFSGRVSKSELLHERKRLYDRWEAGGELPAHEIKDEWKSWRFIALPAGFAAFLLGVGLLILIYLGMFSRLWNG